MQELLPVILIKPTRQISNSQVYNGTPTVSVSNKNTPNEAIQGAVLGQVNLAAAQPHSLPTNNRLQYDVKQSVFHPLLPYEFNINLSSIHTKLNW